MRRNCLIVVGFLLCGLSVVPLAAQDLADVTMAGSQMREDDLPSLAAAPDGSLWKVWLAYADRRDEIAIRRWQDGTWGNLRYVPNISGDVWLPQAGVDGDGRLWVAWTQMLDGNWDMYARSYDPGEQAWGRLVRLTDHPLPDINLAWRAMARASWRWCGRDSAAGTRTSISRPIPAKAAGPIRSRSPGSPRITGSLRPRLIPAGQSGLPTTATQGAIRTCC